jgi:hypothetical protein
MNEIYINIIEYIIKSVAHLLIEHWSVLSVYTIRNHHSHPINIILNMT